MQQTSIVFLVVIAVIFLLFAAVVTAKVAAKPRYKPSRILTDNETEFYWRLRRALPDELIFPQVAMSALIQPATSGKQWRSDFGRIAQKRVDFAIFNQMLELIAVVELDDRTHDAKKDAIRDAHLASAGVRTVRFQSKAKPDASAIRTTLFPPVYKKPSENKLASAQ